MRIQQIQSYAVKNNALNTHPEKFSSKPANYNATDSVSFTGKGASRAAALTLAALTMIGATLGIGTTKAHAASETKNEPAKVETPTAKRSSSPAPSAEMPKTEKVAPPIGPLDMTTISKDEESESVNNPTPSKAPAPVMPTTTPPVGPVDLGISQEEYMAREAERDAKSARSAADYAEAKVQELESQAQRAQSVAYMSVQVRPAKKAAQDAKDTASKIDNYIEMSTASSKMIAKFLDEVEAAIIDGTFTGKEAEEAADLILNARNELAQVEVASESANSVGADLRESASKTSTLAKHTVEAAKDGVNLGNIAAINDSKEETEAAAKDGEAELAALKEAYETLLKDAERIQKLVGKAVTPTPLRVPLKQLPIVDTIEMIYGRTPEQMEAEAVKSEAAMARMDANKLLEEAENLEKKAEALRVIADSIAANSKAEKAAAKADEAKETMEAAKAAAKDSRDAAPARIAGRDALQNEAYSVTCSIIDLECFTKRADEVLQIAEENGIDDEAKAQLLDIIANIDNAVESSEIALADLRAAARAAMDSKNKAEADAALKELDAAKALLEEAASGNKPLTSKVKTAISELIAKIEAATGEKVPPMYSSVGIYPPRVIPCGSYEVYGKTKAEVLATKAEADYASAKQDAQAAKTRAEALAKDAERAKVILALLESEEAENE